MANWILVPCLVALRNEFNELAPNRDKASDGSIGDTKHANSSSDHNPDETGRTPYEDSDKVNEVHAIDVDEDLRLAGTSMQDCVDIIVKRHREGKDNRLQNIIYNRKIWSRSWGWKPKVYTGANPHDKHAHFSAVYSSAQERDTRSWGLVNLTEGLLEMLPIFGDKSEEVKFWQRMHNYVYEIYPNVPKLEEDGDYGAKTAAAFNAFATGASGGQEGYTAANKSLTSWTAIRYLREFSKVQARHAVPAATVDPKLVEKLVNDWLTKNVPAELTISGKITFN